MLPLLLFHPIPGRYIGTLYNLVLLFVGVEQRYCRLLPHYVVNPGVGRLIVRLNLLTLPALPYTFLLPVDVVTVVNVWRCCVDFPGDAHGHGYLYLLYYPFFCR